MFADALKQTGSVRPAQITLRNVINEPALEQLNSGAPPEATLLGQMVAKTVEQLGGQITGWKLDTLGYDTNPSISVSVTYP
jgi:hypothetical protein